MKLIDKDKVVTEIEKRIKETESMQHKFDQFWAGQISAFKGILKILDTFEMKEVDLEKEIDSTYRNYVAFGRQEIAAVAKHFFELGLKA